MNAVPRREKTEQTLSVISTAYIWRSEKGIVECGKSQEVKADCDANWVHPARPAHIYSIF